LVALDDLMIEVAWLDDALTALEDLVMELFCLDTTGVETTLETTGMNDELLDVATPERHCLYQGLKDSQ
jgi:hypothetical protein